MSLTRRAAFVATTLALAGCASPATEPPFVIRLAPTRAADPAALAAPPSIQVMDVRDLADRAVVGEVHAPGGGAPPPVLGGAGGGPGEAAGAATLLFVPTGPTGRTLRVADAAEVTRAVERTLVDAWRRTGRRWPEGQVLEVSVSRFWIQPSWTTTCEVCVDLRLRDAGGTVRWQQRLSSRIDVFEGWFTAAAFERVASTALDLLGDEAARAFASEAFQAALDGR